MKCTDVLGLNPEPLEAGEALTRNITVALL